MTEYQSKAILATAGIDVPAGGFAHTPDDAAAIAGRIGYPVVLKAQAPTLAHKSDAGGIVVGIRDEETLRSSWSRIAQAVSQARPELVLEGMLVERMAPAGVEVVVGAKRDRDWGIVLLAGVGGIWIEALGDVILFPDGATPDEIVSGMRGLKAAGLLTGSRGATAVDLEAIAVTLLRLGTIMRGAPNISEIEINPLAAYADGVLALDTLIVSAPPHFFENAGRNR